MALITNRCMVGIGLLTAAILSFHSCEATSGFLSISKTASADTDGPAGHYTCVFDQKVTAVIQRREDLLGVENEVEVIKSEPLETPIRFDLALQGEFAHTDNVTFAKVQNGVYTAMDGDMLINGDKYDLTVTLSTPLAGGGTASLAGRCEAVKY